MSIVQYNNRPAPFPWLPAALDQPYWDASDLSTMFQDTAGLVPASAPGQPIALMRDKSRHGINLIQPTVAARPMLSRMPITGRRNLLAYTEDFSNIYWLKSGAFLNTPTKLTESATNAPHKVYSPSVGNQGVYTAFFDVSAAERSLCEIWVGNSAPSVGAGTRFNLQNGTVVHSRTVGGSIALNSGMINLGVGIFRCYVAMENTSTQSMQAHLFIAADGLPNNAIAYQGDGVSGINVYRSQMEIGSVATPYQKVTNAFDVTEAGVPDVRSLFRDPIDDALNANLPAGTYTRINVSPEQVISFDEGIVINASVNILRQPYTSWTSYINRTLTSAEKSAIIAWWASR